MGTEGRIVKEDGSPSLTSVFTLLWQSLFSLSGLPSREAHCPTRDFSAAGTWQGPWPKGFVPALSTALQSLCPWGVRWLGHQMVNFCMITQICPTPRAGTHLNLRLKSNSKTIYSKKEKSHILFQHRGDQISRLNCCWWLLPDSITTGGQNNWWAQSATHKNTVHQQNPDSQGVNGNARMKHVTLITIYCQLFANV